MGRQCPVSGLDGSNSFEKLAEMGPVFTVLVYICAKEQWLRAETPTGDACIYALAICVVGVCVVDEPLNGVIKILLPDNGPFL